MERRRRRDAVLRFAAFELGRAAGSPAARALSRRARRGFDRLRGAPPAEGARAPAPPPWPPEDLEYLRACPACGSPARRPLYLSMVDRRPNPLPGEWNLHLCASCEAAYLDPRPTRASIMRADPRRALPRRRGVLRAWIDRTAVALRNGFVATRTGHRLRPASRLGPVLYALRPWRARRALTQVAWLPSDRPGALLDVGADSALTVEAACSAGWSVSVVTVHRHPPSWLDGRGIAVHTGSVAEAGLAPRSFDLITVQGALERMHDPVAELGECARLLRPGGRLRVVAPNLRSAGHERFRRRWRIIDVPRTLIIPTPQALDALLRRAGFGAVAPASAPPRSGAGFHLVGRGGRRRRLDPRRVLRRAVMAASAAAADLRGLLRPARADFLARVAAPRPAGSPAAALAA